MEKKESLFLSSGNFRVLKSFQYSRLVYDITVRFCDRFIERRSRTHDQMVQAGRSGVQNIAEGNLAGATSKEMEIKLTNVARASLGELMLDYEDFLRHRGLEQWSSGDGRRGSVINQRFQSVDEVKAWVKDCYNRGDVGRYTPSGRLKELNEFVSEYMANVARVLIMLCMKLLKNQLGALERQFVEGGGMKEKMYKVRSERRREQEGEERKGLYTRK